MDGRVVEVKKLKEKLGDLDLYLVKFYNEKDQSYKQHILALPDNKRNGTNGSGPTT